MKIKTKVIDTEGFDRILTRIAHEILEKNKGIEEVRFVLHSMHDLRTYEEALTEILD